MILAHIFNKRYSACLNLYQPFTLQLLVIVVNTDKDGNVIAKYFSIAASDEALELTINY